MGKPKAPKPPDYAAAAEAQGEANLNSAVGSNVMNQINQVGPTGSLTYKYDNFYTLPDGTKIPVATATTALSPEQQELYNQQTAISQNLNAGALEGIQYVRDSAAKPIDLSALPSMAGGLARTQFQGEIDPTQLGIQGNYDFSNVTAMPKPEDFNATRDKVTDAYMQRLQPYLDKQQSALENKLATQGITNGSEAWGWDKEVFNRGANDQRIAALLAGDQASQNLFNNAMGVRQQGVSEAVAQGNFGNAAQGQEWSQNAQAAQFGNQAAEANFGQGLASSQFQNQARAQALQEQDYLRNQPLNMLNALRSGNQVTMPQFGNVSGGSQIQAAPIYAAANDQFNAQMQNYQAKLAQQSSMLSGLGSIGGAAVMASDRRLKTDIQRIGQMVSGLPLYAYRYLWDKVQRIGVMADEVAIYAPEALGPTIAGYATVNYGKL